ncbi:MAG: hypothetical protein J5761_05675 [Paludibacteraceae bacterium]|nr:hypothetical protein [Paludibacteraceae bacterium]
MDRSLHSLKEQRPLVALAKRQKTKWLRLFIFVFCPLSMVLLPSCRFREDMSVDFTDLEAAKGLKFQVISQSETDLSQGLPYNCYLPDGTPVTEYEEENGENGDATLNDANGANGGGPRKTSSVTGTAIVQELLKHGNQDKAIEIVGTYPSLDGEYNEVTLSGKVILPKGRKPKRLILVSHYTVGSNAEAPSNCFSLEGILVRMGYGLIIPDYRGYGITVNEVHPYLVMMETAWNVTDMYFAVRDWLKAVDLSPEHDDIYLMGYSQGGANTMAVEYLCEMAYDDPNYPDYYIPIHRVFAGGGPYDVKATYERFVNTDTAGYPVAVPLVLQGMIKGNNLNMQIEDMIRPELCDKVIGWVNSKKYTTGQINKLIGTKVTHEILTQEAMDQTSNNVAELYKAMTENSVVSYDWCPKSSVYIMHSMDDETVPYTNATNAKAKWKNANITYNFGHYGGHVKTCIRFIFSVQTLLEQEEKEMKQYE